MFRFATTGMANSYMPIFTDDFRIISAYTYEYASVLGA